MLLFLVMEIVAAWFFFESSPYQRARFIGASNVVLGGVDSRLRAVGDYFSLSTQNDRLALENARLRRRLSEFENAPTVRDSSYRSSRYIVAKVVNNSITKRDNFITIDKGTLQGVKPEMALINNDGIVGYVLYCSANYSVAISVLNKSDFRTSGKIKGTDFTGSISWDGLWYENVDFDKVPKYAEIKLGDTIVTTEYSNIFPPDEPIGTVVEFELINGTFINARLKLFPDMSRLTYVYAVELPSAAERAELESKITQQDE